MIFLVLVIYFHHISHLSGMDSYTYLIKILVKKYIEYIEV
jgi:hypothetical protein